MRNKLDEKHILSLTDGENGSMEAQVALNELQRYFLGDDWYVVDPLSQKQVNTHIVYEIESRYKGCKIRKNKKEK